jgi:ribosomal protein L7Ae-like RNA K-turn-binding protein
MQRKPKDKADNKPLKCVGLKEVARQADAGLLSEIILARDTDSAFKQKVNAIARKNRLPVRYAAASAELGRLAKIDVKAGVVGNTIDSPL